MIRLKKRREEKRREKAQKTGIVRRKQRKKRVNKKSDLHKLLIIFIDAADFNFAADAAAIYIVHILFAYNCCYILFNN